MVRGLLWFIVLCLVTSGFAEAGGLPDINPSTIPGLKSGVCSELILSGAFDPVLKAWGCLRSEVRPRVPRRNINFDKIVFLSSWTKAGKVQLVKGSEEILGETYKRLTGTVWK